MKNVPDCIVKIIKALVKIHVASSHVMSSGSALVVSKISDTTVTFSVVLFNTLNVVLLHEHIFNIFEYF